MSYRLTLTEMLAGPIPICQHHKWNDGDLEVISSDNIKFCVPSYLLQAASWVTRYRHSALTIRPFAT